MNTYVAPIHEMRFVLRELAGLEDVRSLPGYGDLTEDLVEAVLQQASRFATEMLAPLNAAGDRQGAAFENGQVLVPDGFTQAYRHFVDAGWTGVALPAEWGGQGLPGLIETALGEIWSAANLAFSLAPLLTQSAAKLLLHHGDAGTRPQYLPKLCSGEWTGTMLLTESHAGSDLAQVRTRAVPRAGHYRLFGQKVYITFGEHEMATNIVHAVLARTPDARHGIGGLSLFLVPKFLPDEEGCPGARNDVRCISIERKLGIRASPTAVMALGEGEGAIGHLIGEEGRGLELMFTMMNHARLAVGVTGVGIAERARQQARAYALQRIQGRLLGALDAAPVHIARHPDVQRMLLGMKAQTMAARALAYFTAARNDSAQRHPDEAVRRRQQRCVDLLTPVVKAWCTDVGIEVADTAIQVHGGIGYIEESGAPQLLRDARIGAIYEGTNGIQAMHLVTRKVAGDGGAAVRELIAEISAAGVDLGAAGNDADLQAIGVRLADARSHLLAATEWLVHTFPTDPGRVAAGGVLYLRLLGNVAGGWLLATAARRAHDHLRAGQGDRPLLVSMRKTAQFFADTRLAESGGLRSAFMAAGEALADLDPYSHL